MESLKDDELYDDKIDQDYLFTEEEYQEYKTSIGSIIKKIWITFQALMMTQFMIRGLIYYSRTIKGWSKVKSLLVFQGLQFIYLVLNEYIWGNMTGVYLNLLFCSYGHFLTFCIVFDSCQTIQDDQRNTCMHIVNRYMRRFFHLFFVTLLCLVYFARSCYESLYPPVFCMLGIFICCQ